MHLSFIRVRPHALYNLSEIVDRLNDWRFKEHTIRSQVETHKYLVKLYDMCDLNIIMIELNYF